MKCRTARKLFSAYLDAELNFADEERLREHLAQCRTCCGEVSALARTQRLVRGLPPIEPDPGFCESVLRRVRELPAASGAREELLRDGAAAVWRRWVQGAWLRPALGAALGLFAGVMVGVHAPQLADAVRGDRPAAPATAVVAPPASPPAAAVRTPASVTSPLADIDLARLTTASDSARIGSEPEYVLEPYVTDPQRGLIPASGAYGRTVSGDWDGQNDAFVTF
jgi:anti-sigma factor RsiW